jgi:hypothetical protein
MPTVLPITMQRQCCSAWCWAAVISSIVQSLPSPCGKLQQGQIATSVLRTGTDCTPCCPDGSPALDAICNLPADISFALKSLRLSFSRAQTVQRVGFGGISQELGANRPVIAEIEYDDPPGGTHAVLIYGCDVPDLLRIGDPANGQTVVVDFNSYSTSDAYADPATRVRGTWTSVYFLDAL